MGKTIPIQLSIPNPCSENWDEMTVSERGRYCAHCQKQVIDFTKFSDVDLFNFFEKNNERVCGRVYSFQLNRALSLPPQPHSRLYRMAIALGLTLLTTQTPSYARKNAPLLEQIIFDEPVSQVTNDSTNSGNIIRGIVIDENKEPVIGAIVKLSDTASRGLTWGTTTDMDGRFHIILSPDQALIRTLVLSVSYTGYKKQEVIVMSAHFENGIKIKLEVNNRLTGEVLIQAGGIRFEYIPQQDPFIPGMNSTIRREDLKHMGGN